VICRINGNGKGKGGGGKKKEKNVKNKENHSLMVQLIRGLRNAKKEEGKGGGGGIEIIPKV
jgi:hypothetical protein